MKYKFLFSSLSIYLMYTCIYFTLTPLYLYYATYVDTYLTVVIISIISNFMIILGYILKFNYRLNVKRKLIVNVNFFVYISLIFFIIFMIYTLVSFGNIPLLSVILGEGDPNILRGELFKGRIGYEIILLYLSAFFYYVFIPISIILAFHFKLKVRYFFLITALLFSIGTLQKALILNILLPLFAYFLIKKKMSFKLLIIIFSILLVYFIIMIQITGHGESHAGIVSYENFFSSTYTPNSALDYFFWRLFAVPIYTSVDTIYVFENWMGSNHLFGATSTFLSSLFNIEKVELEKLVFQYQFGGYNALANANTYFAVDMYVNFSWIGLIMVSFFVGAFLKSMHQTNDLAIYAISYLLVYQLINGSFLGIMLSSGFFYVIVHVLFFKFKLKGYYVR